MSIEDIRLYTLNASAMAISFTNAERALKILLLTVSIIYTVLKIIEMKNKKDEAEQITLVNQNSIQKIVKYFLMLC
jgi:uncharacterized membrane protein